MPDLATDPNALPQLPAGNQPTDEPEELPQGAEGEDTAPADAAPESDEQQPSDDEVEFEYEGEVFRGSQKLRDAVMRQADYTRKTQAVAEHDRAVREREQAFADQAKAMQTNFAIAATLHTIDQQLAAYRKVDWVRLRSENADLYETERLRFETLKDRRGDVASDLETKQREAIESQRAERAKRGEQGRAALASADPSMDWPGLSPAVEEKLYDFGIGSGLTHEEIVNTTDPRLIKILHLAMLGKQVIAKQRQAVKGAAPQKPVVKPIRQAAPGRAAPSNAPRDSDPQDVWLKKRREQLERKAAAG